MLVESALIIFFALFLDAILGETRRFHPLVGFGFFARHIEKRLNHPETTGSLTGRIAGGLALVLLLVPLTAAVMFVRSILAYPQLIDLALLYFAIGRQSLLQHAMAIIKPLQDNALEPARQQVSMIVSRDTAHMQKNDIINATLESIIENSNDAVFAAIFWFIIAGAPGVLVYRLVNTLDAMWGYKNSRFYYFGWAAARLDDALNWLPARLTVLSFALYARSLNIIPLSFAQGSQCASPNAGPVMSAGACALGVKLGGDAYYQGKKISKPQLGQGQNAKTEDIQRSMKLLNHTLIIWLIIISLAVLILKVNNA